MGKNILIFIHHLKIGGGAERIAAEVGTHLNMRGHNVTFLTRKQVKETYDYEGDIICLEEGSSSDSYPLQFTFKLIKRARKVSKICRDKDIDTVISFLMVSNFSAVLSKILFKHDAKVIISVRNNPLNVGDKLDKILIKGLYPWADTVVSLSKGVEHILKTDYSLDNTTTIWNLQNIKKFDRLAKEEVSEEHRKIFEKNFTYITIGSMTRQKGHWYLLRSFKRVADRHEDLNLIILGDGNLRKRLEEIIKKLGLEDKVFLPGIVDNVFPYLKKSDCFVFSSIWEGFGNVLTEALSQDLPVISTDCVAGPREILCPNLEMGTELEYPYFGEYGVLVSRFEDKIVFKTLEEKPLTEEEKVFGEVMVEMKEDERLREKYSNVSERVKDFEADKIIDEWEEII